jgi:molybdopterin/thiamine biosynthesis adenylyltransferase
MTHSMMRAIKPNHVLFQEIGAESALLDLNKEHYFSLNDVGTRMWSVLVSATSIHQAQQTLQREYEVETAQIQHDLHDLIEQLVQHDLLQLVEA